MPLASPSSGKRPSLTERTSSTHSLASTPKQHDRQQPHKIHRVTRHARNVSHGKGLSKLGRVQSTTNVTVEGRNHQRQKSGPITPGQSPKSPISPNVKRNSSHVTLPRNTSQGNLKKNFSAGALASARNSRSHGNLAKLGAPPSQKPREQEEQKQGVFDLGNHSSEEDEEGEWEDSTTQSPELSRNHSKASTPLRARTPTSEYVDREGRAAGGRISSPPTPALHNNINRSAPNLKGSQAGLASRQRTDPALLNNQPKPTKAPPAMSTISAVSSQSNLQRPDRGQASQKQKLADSGDSYVKLGGPVAATSSSGSQGVSHFLPSSSVATSRKSYLPGESDDNDDESDFMSNYKPQAAESHDQAPTSTRSSLGSIPSRTQQKLDLQRRETMRVGSSGPATPGGGRGLTLGGPSSTSLHNRSGGKSHMRSLDDKRAAQYTYEAASKQLTIARRFRNPIVESLRRLLEQGAISGDDSSVMSGKARPPSRRGLAGGATTPRYPLSRSPEDKKTPMSGSGGSAQQDAKSKQRASRVTFQMASNPQISPDGVGLTTTEDSVDGDDDDENHGMSAEEALLRRIWESPIQIEADGVQVGV